MAEWHWEHHPDDLLDDLPEEAISEVERLAKELATRDSMIYLEGAAYTGPGPGLRTQSRGRLLVTYLTDIRGERIVIVQVTCFG